MSTKTSYCCGKALRAFKIIKKYSNGKIQKQACAHFALLCMGARLFASLVTCVIIPPST